MHKNQYTLKHNIWSPPSSLDITDLFGELNTEEDEMIKHFQWAYYRKVTPKVLDRAIDSAYYYFRDKYFSNLWEHTDEWNAILEESIHDKMEGVWYKTIDIRSRYDFCNGHTRMPDQIIVSVMIDDKEYRRNIPVL